jgi:hypothetical protein
LEILKQHVRDSDERTSAAARQALERLANGRESAASRVAEEALAQLQRSDRSGAIPWRFRAPVQMNPAMGAPQPIARRISVRVAGGSRTVEVDELNRQLRIRQDARGRLRVEVRQQRNGRQTSQQFEADSAAELRTRHPEAYKWYQRYSRHLRNAGQPAPPARRQLPPRNVQDQQAEARDRKISGLERATDHLARRLRESRERAP